LDSLKVSEDQVNSELNRRINVIVSQLGSVDKLEEIYKKSVIEIKLELKKNIEEELLIEEQRQKIIAGINVTPKEVKDFFNSIPKDSLPDVGASVEISHISMRPKPSESNKQLARKRLESILSDIKSGKISFEDAAKKYSQDAASAKQFGMLGEFGRGDMVPEFEEVVFNLTPGQLSPVFESPYGYHVVKLLSRSGDRVKAAHILIRPVIDEADEKKVEEKLAEIKRLILSDSLKFHEAAKLYSDDLRTKDNGGIITNNMGETRIPFDQLDADLYLKVDKMKPGDITDPMPYISQEGELVRAYHLVYLRKRHPPHRANYKDDYPMFQKAALQAKQAEELEKWLIKNRKQIYLDVRFDECAQAIQDWYSPDKP
jgi:peptidyl-prolyl cis-trans isomerase SurA